jgi:hypothetical protein
MSRRYGRVRRKKDLVYSVDELLALYDVCRNTVSNWVRASLRPVDDRQPQLFRGAELIRFHTERSERQPRAMRTGEFRCTSCGLRVVPESTPSASAWALGQ